MIYIIAPDYRMFDIYCQRKRLSKADVRYVSEVRDLVGINEVTIVASDSRGMFDLHQQSKLIDACQDRHIDLRWEHMPEAID